LGGPVIFFTFFIGYHLLGGYLHKIIGTPTDGRLRSVTPMKIMMWRHTKCIFSKFLWTDCPSGRFFSVLFGGGTPSKSFDSARRIRPRYPRVWGKPDAIWWFIFGDIGHPLLWESRANDVMGQILKGVFIMGPNGRSALHIEAAVAPKAVLISEFILKCQWIFILENLLLVGRQILLGRH
jgi:hypothetical protein